MRGNTLTEFMDDLLTMGGPEKEFLFRLVKDSCPKVYYHNNPKKLVLKPKSTI